MESSKKLFRLVKIVDAHSNLKSPAAIYLVDNWLSCKDIEYEDKFSFSSAQTSNHAKNDENFLCENTFYLEPRKVKVCHIPIKDIFILEEAKSVDRTPKGVHARTPKGGAPHRDQGTSSSKQYFIGNTCIQQFVVNHAIVNLTQEDYDNILLILKIYKLCPFCNKKISISKTYHAKCKAQQARPEVDNYLVDKVTLLTKIFAGNSTISRINNEIQVATKSGWIKSPFTTKDKNMIERFIADYPRMYKDADKLAALKNNCIVQSVLNRPREPTDKQLVFIHLILDDYDRIKELDDEGINEKYLKYGYVYPRIRGPYQKGGSFPASGFAQTLRVNEGF